MPYQKQIPRFKVREPKLDRSSLRTPVVFYSARVADGLDGRDTAFEEVYRTFANVYNPSLKDVEISKGFEVRARATIQIRNPLGTYQPENEHFVEIRDRRFKGQKWQILDIRPDFVHQEFMTIVLGGAYHG